MSSRYPILIALLLGLALAAPARAAAPECPGPDNPGGIWKQKVVEVYFNSSLDAPLEKAAVCLDANNVQYVYSLGDATTRRQCFDAAVNAWNVALTNLCGEGKTPVQLALKAEDNTLWGVDQSNNLCFGSLDVVLRQVLHNNDNKNVASTGHNHNGRKDAANNFYGPGWIQANEISTDHQERLAETYPRLAIAGTLAEADIGWMTHFKDQCADIPWDYRLFKANNIACEANVPEPNSYDFYSVMLHELGHLLGLGHFSDPDGVITDNCMTFTIKKGERKQVTKLETDCLKKLYCPDPTPAHNSSWGDLRRIYR